MQPNLALREQIVSLHEDGLSQYAIAAQLGRAQSTVSDHLKAHRESNTPTPIITGIHPDDLNTPHEDVITRLLTRQERTESRMAMRDAQVVEIPDSGPIGLAFVSDKHMGGDCDYRAMVDDVELIRDTPGMYAIETGDNSENWLGSLAGLKGEQVVTSEEEYELVKWWFSRLTEHNKLLAVVAGNHDNRTKRYAGLDLIRQALQGAALLYDCEEVRFRLKLGAAEWRIKARHKWPGHSKYNPAHAMTGGKAGYRFGGDDYDIAVGGHKHVGTMFFPDIFHMTKRLVVMVGTYKMDDEYGRAGGFPGTFGRGCGALIMRPDGRWQQQDDLESACDYLTYLRR